MLKIGHQITRPGRNTEDEPITINVPEELLTVPGVPQAPADVNFYSREYPLESQNIDLTADREWVWTVYTDEIREYREEHDRNNKPLVDAAAVSGDIEPTAPPAGRDITEEVRIKARELGFGEVGFTRYDRHYTYASKKRWAKFDHAVVWITSLASNVGCFSPSGAIENRSQWGGSFRLSAKN